LCQLHSKPNFMTLIFALKKYHLQWPFLFGGAHNQPCLESNHLVPVSYLNNFIFVNEGETK
jgi:hypothetical protein